MIWEAKFNIWPPSVNSLWRHVGSKTLLSKEGRKFFTTMDFLIDMERARRHLPDTPIDHDVEVQLRFTPPRLGRRDVDNLLKGVLDSMTKGRVWKDDSLVRKLTAELVRSKTPGGLVEIWIEE